MNNEIEISSHKFKLGKINTMSQFHIVRRLSPILGALARAADPNRKESESDLVAEIIESLSKLNDADSEYVLHRLWNSVEYFQGTNYAKLSNGTTLMFENLGLMVVMQAAGEAFKYNLEGFFAAIPQALHGDQLRSVQ